MQQECQEEPSEVCSDELPDKQTQVIRAIYSQTSPYLGHRQRSLTSCLTRRASLIYSKSIFYSLSSVFHFLFSH